MEVAADIAAGRNGEFLMDRELDEAKGASPADKVAMIGEARVLFGAAAARELWADLSLPTIRADDSIGTGRSVMRERIRRVASVPDGMTIGVIVNRCREFGRNAVEQEVASLVANGELRVDRSIAGNGKLSERFIAN